MSGRRIRVLHILPGLDYGGMERLVGHIVRGIPRDRYESHVLILYRLGHFGRSLAEQCQIHRANAQPGWSMLWPRSLVRQIREIRPDVVHTHSGIWYKGTLAARMAGVTRVVHTEHGRTAPTRLERLVDSLAAGRTDVTVAVSESMAELLRSNLVPAHRSVRVILNGVDTEQFYPRPDPGRIRSELRLEQDTLVVGCIGRLEPIKGFDIMIEAFAQFRALANGRVALVIAGGGSQLEALRRQVLALGLSDNVHLLGWRDDLQDLLATFDLFTMSSRSEGTSVSLLEAMSSGLCPVVTDVGGNAAVLGDALAHRLVPPERPDLLAHAWQTAACHPDQRNADRERARQRVVESHSIRPMLSAYQNLYEAGDRSRL
jgi:glycosyltransferase involved in cell wall biosynthesis